MTHAAEPEPWGPREQVAFLCEHLHHLAGDTRFSLEYRQGLDFAKARLGEILRDWPLT